MKVHSTEWFRLKIDQTKVRVNQQWSPLMRSNAVFAAATLPQSPSVQTPIAKMPVESLDGLIDGKLFKDCIESD